MNPRIRAGYPPCASSGCNGPVEGECMGLCTHRVNTHCMTKPVATVMPKELPVQFSGPEPGVLTKLRTFYRNLAASKAKVKA